MTTARVLLWGRDIAAVTWDERHDIGVFQYAPEFVPSGIQVAPLTMPLAENPIQFPALARETFRGLPGLLSDSLPDKFGNALIDAWRTRQGDSSASFNPVQRLCYVGTRGMGALEFEPVIRGAPTQTAKVEVESLVQLANQVLNQREALQGTLSGDDTDVKAIEDILRVGTSAGGARAKGILAWNEATGEFRSGQLPVEKGYSLWIMKFDGVDGNRDKELADPQGYGRIEYAYSEMAREAGIEMMRCHLHEESGRAHFMTQRFDRSPEGKKIHMQSLGAMRHFDFNQAGAYSYEQAIETCRMLNLPQPQITQQFRRAVFNIVARNQDDHVKNIAYLMDQRGQWKLAPAFDVAYSYNPQGAWTSRHQMSMNGKRDEFTREDVLPFASYCDIKSRAAKRIVDEVTTAVSRWRQHAEDAGVPLAMARAIYKNLRLNLV